MIRRKFLGTLTLSSTAMALGAANKFAPIFDDALEDLGKPLQLVQITDTHVYDQKESEKRAGLFMEQLSRVAPNPDVVMHTGDIIHDALGNDRQKVQKQWKLWHSLKGQLPNNVHYAIGNHDVWGHGPKSDKMYGKKWVIDELELEDRYYSFSKGSWKFIVLDSTQSKDGQWYTAAIDGLQREWLQGELDNTPADTQVMIVSHIPILSTCIFDWAKSENGIWTVSGALMHSDSHEVQAILREYPQVKLCISGHLHLLDSIRYDNIDYLGAGAVSGNWWNSETFRQTHCGFCVFSLYPDGSYQREYHEYSWS